MIVLFGWFMWFAVTCFLTLVGILVIAGAACLYVFGWLLAQWKPTAGAGCMAIGKMVFMGTGQLIDRLNGHKRKQPESTVVVVHTIHTIHTAPAPIQPPPALPEPSQRPPPPSKAQQIADAKAAYVKADLIDDDDDPALLEQRIGAIVGVSEKASGAERA
jgi:hypothetical protein